MKQTYGMTNKNTELNMLPQYHFICQMIYVSRKYKSHNRKQKLKSDDYKPRRDASLYMYK